MGGAPDPEQSCRLGRDAVGRDQLLLLADGAQEAERVGAETGHADERDTEQPEAAGERDPHALGPAAAGEHQERQHEAGGELHAHARGEGERRRARTPFGRGRDRGAQEQGEREGQQQQRVVVRAADCVHQQHRVQAEEHECERRRAPEAPGRAGRQPDRAEARGRRERLERPQPARQAEWRGGIRREREQRPVGRVLERPPDEAEHRVRSGFGREMRIGIEPVQRPHPCEREVPEDVLGDQRWAEQQDQVRRHDRGGQHGQRQDPRGRQHHEVARADHEHERLEAALAELGAEPSERAREPAGPAAGVRGHIARGRRRGLGAEHEDGGDERHQRDASGEAQGSVGGGAVEVGPQRPASRCVPARAARVLGLLSGRRRSAGGLH